jgi:hypothetical protein
MQLDLEEMKEPKRNKNRTLTKWGIYKTNRKEREVVCVYVSNGKENENELQGTNWKPRKEGNRISGELKRKK